LKLSFECDIKLKSHTELSLRASLIPVFEKAKGSCLECTHCKGNTVFWHRHQNKWEWYY